MTATLSFLFKISVNAKSLYWRNDTATFVTSYLPAGWHDKHTYLSSLGMLGITQLNSFFFLADHIIFNNGYIKHAHKWQRMTNDNNSNKRKQA